MIDDKGGSRDKRAELIFNWTSAFVQSHSPTSIRAMTPDPYWQGGTGVPTVYQDLLGYPTGITSLGPSIDSPVQIVLLLQSIEALASEIEMLKDQLAEQANRPHVASILLNDLSSEEYELVRPLSIVLEETEDECLARWPEVNAFGLAATSQEAIRRLKENVVELYEDVFARPVDTLGEIAVETRRILGTHVARRM